MSKPRSKSANTHTTHQEPDFKHDDPEKEWIKETRQWFQDHQKELTAGAQEAIQSFDRTLLTLCSGAIGLSIVFVKDLITTRSTIWLFIGAEIAWVACLVCNLLSFIFSHHSFRKEAKILEDYYHSLIEGRDLQGTQKNNYSTATVVMNYVGLVGFIVGVGLFITFIINNLP